MSNALRSAIAALHGNRHLTGGIAQPANPFPENHIWLCHAPYSPRWLSPGPVLWMPVQNLWICQGFIGDAAEYGYASYGIGHRAFGLIQSSWLEP